MPLYDYTCRSCGRINEVHVPINEVGTHLEVCACGYEMERELFSARNPRPPAVIFKGNGFYSTDNRKGKP
jgi:putative FmdB family regulatory protein